MVQFLGRKNIDFGHSEVTMDVLISWVDDDVWMPYRVLASFADPRDVSLVDFFSRCDGVVEFDGIGSISEEGVSGLQWLYYFEGAEKLFQFSVGFDFGVPVAFPLYFDIVTALFEHFVFSESGFVHFLHGAVSVCDGKPVSIF